MKKLQKVLMCRWLRYGTMLLFPVLFLLAACNDGQPHGGEGPSKEFRINCVMLSHAQVKSWVENGWTRPGDSAIKEILLQFYSPDITNASSNLQLLAYPGRTVTDVKINGAQTLAVDTTCKAVTFTGKVVLANNEAVIEKLNIINPDGSLKDFDYIRFTPQSFAGNKEYINFKVETVTKGIATAVEDGDTRPCPPWCNPDDE